MQLVNSRSSIAGALLVLMILATGCIFDSDPAWYLTGCKFNATAWSPWYPVVPDVSSEQLAAAPAEVVIESHRVILDARLNRDFMPICEPGGRPMTGWFGVTEADSLALPPELSCDFVWVMQGDETWVAAFGELGPWDNWGDHMHVVSAREGPKWEPGTSADVVLRIGVGTGEYQLLAARDVVITESF